MGVTGLRSVLKSHRRYTTITNSQCLRAMPESCLPTEAKVVERGISMATKFLKPTVA